MAVARYHVRIEVDEDGFYVASVPALPGCFSDGRTREEALKNLQEAMELWTETEDEKAIHALPDPKQNLLTKIAIPSPFIPTRIC